MSVSVPRTWATGVTYGARHLGFQVVDRASGSVAFRMDDRKQRVIVDDDGGQGVKFFGWEVADAAALDAIAAQIERAGIEVERGSRALADERHVADLIVLTDPLGLARGDLPWAEVASDPFKPGRNISGFRTGSLGLGHVVMTVERIDRGARLLSRGARLLA